MLCQLGTPQNQINQNNKVNSNENNFELIKGRGKPDYLVKSLSEQSREPKKPN